MKNDIIRLNLEGKSNTEIKNITGHSLTTIRKYLKEAGLFSTRASADKLLKEIKRLVNLGKQILKLRKF